MSIERRAGSGGRPPDRGFVRRVETRESAVGDASKKAGELRDFHPVKNSETAAAIVSLRTLCAKIQRFDSRGAAPVASDTIRTKLLALSAIVLNERPQWERTARGGKGDDSSVGKTRSQIADTTRMVGDIVRMLGRVISDAEAVSVEALRAGKANPISKEDMKPVRELRRRLSDWSGRWETVARTARKMTRSEEAE